MRVSIFGVLGITCLLAGIFFVVKQRNAVKKPTIAILQIASHMALDAARDGFMESVHAGLGDEYAFIIKNADGSVANAQTIAQGLVARSEVKGFFALGTPAAQALVQQETQRPIFFTAVTYPEKSGLAQKNVAGISDFFDLEKLVEFAHALVPEAKNIGVLYNPGSEVTQAEMHEIERACAAKNLTPVLIAGVTESDILGALKSSVRKIEVCVAPTDNTISSVMPAIAEICKKAHVPLIVADKTLVASGPLAGIGMDYYQLGFDAGLAAVKVFLEGCPVSEIGILNAEPEIAMNEAVFEELVQGGCNLKNN